MKKTAVNFLLLLFAALVMALAIWGPEAISGYRNELVSDYSTAAAVAGGQADTALGESCAARSFPGLTFLPVCEETLYLILRSENLCAPGFQAVADTIASENFRRTLSLQTGYDTSHTGEIITL